MNDLRAERLVVLVVAAAQFINVLEFMIVMPLGPDFALQLGVPASRLAFVAAAYTAAAAVAGIAGAFFLDRFGRRRALAVSMAGLILSTASIGLATSFASLMASRALAGLFGGPATSISMSIVADAVPAERRGRAFSTVLTSTAVAAVLGVPVALELARVAGWRTPFVAVALLGLVALYLTTRMPRSIDQQRGASPESAWHAIVSLLRDGTVQRSYLLTFVVQLSMFLIIPNISAYLQLNLGFPRERLGWLYFVGGLASVLATRLVGRLVDRYGSMPVATVALAFIVSVLTLGFAREMPVRWVWVAFVTFMLALGARNVSYNTLVSKVPASPVRARFQSLQSAVQHVAISVGGGMGGWLLSTAPNGTLQGMPRLAYLAVALSLLVPLLMWRVERRVGGASRAA